MRYIFKDIVLHPVANPTYICIDTSVQYVNINYTLVVYQYYKKIIAKFTGDS